MSVATLTVTPGASLDALAPATGPAGTTVSISGGNFPVTTALVFMLDTTTVLTPTGDLTTRTYGTFMSTITIPAGTAAGAHTITVTAGTSSATATFTVSVPATIDTFTPASGAAGSLVTITGANFLASTPIVFKFDTAVITPNSGAQTGTGGTIASVITIPATAAAGAHTVSVTVGTITVSKEFAVTSVTPTTTPPTTVPPTTTPAASKAVLSINQTGHAVGSTIGIGGAGFTAGATVTIKYDTVVVTTVAVTANGTFISPFFTAPVSKKGDHIITASDGTNTATTTFTMESTAPKVPPPLTPGVGAKVKSPVTFTWTEVTDDSLPVTYSLQVATDKSFGTSSLVLNKTGLTGSSYAMTAIEGLQVAETDISYYWRIEAIDAASNESGWTGANQFYISSGLKLSGWIVYAAIAVGALIFFLLGLWVGRRTAFSY
jgi:hypothetical protein